jgi:hypothetical protein
MEYVIVHITFSSFGPIMINKNVYLHKRVDDIHYGFKNLALHEQLTHKPAKTLRTAIRKYPYISKIFETGFIENGIFFSERHKVRFIHR